MVNVLASQWLGVFHFSPRRGLQVRNKMSGKLMDMSLELAMNVNSMFQIRGFIPQTDLKLILIRYRRTIVNEAATASPVQPIINMGQGFL